MANDLWRTSPIVFEYFNKRCKFTLDVAADDENHLLPAYITKEGDALTQSWAGERCFMNPPYSRGNLPEWTAKAADETYPYTDRKTAILVFGVLPFDMVGWFRNNVRDRATLFIPDARIPFIDPETGQLENSPRQNTLFALWETGERPKKPQILIYRDMMIEYLTDHNWELTDYALLEYKPILELIAEHKKAQSTAGEGGK